MPWAPGTTIQWNTDGTVAKYINTNSTTESTNWLMQKQHILQLIRLLLHHYQQWLKGLSLLWYGGRELWRIRRKIDEGGLHQHDPTRQPMSMETQPENICSCGCTPTVLQVYNVTCTQVCGRVNGYQFGSTDAFGNYHIYDQTSIERTYVEGVSLTHGQPRKHIWAYAAAIQLFPAIANYYTCPYI